MIPGTICEAKERKGGREIKKGKKEKGERKEGRKKKGRKEMQEKSWKIKLNLLPESKQKQREREN